MLFSFQNITHDYNGKTLFTDIGFTMNEGSLLTLRGANGSGKTTLLKILAGLVRPRYGFVFYDGFEITEDISCYHKSLNFLGHKNALDEDFTVIENLKFFASLVDNKEAIEAVVKYFSLEDKLNVKITELSAGWQRRIALARLMIKKSKIWLLDEPFTNLDEDVIDITLKMIATFCDQGGIVVLSTHQAIKLPFGMTLEMEDFK